MCGVEEGEGVTLRGAAGAARLGAAEVGEVSAERSGPELVCRALVGGAEAVPHLWAEAAPWALQALWPRERAVAEKALWCGLNGEEEAAAQHTGAQVVMVVVVVAQSSTIRSKQQPHPA